MARVLIVEDDKNLAESMLLFLKKQNHVLEHVGTADDANFRLSTYKYDLVLLDLGLPDDSGISVLKNFRGNGGTTPILILTGRSQISQKEEGLDAGADDYVTKPFDLREVAARVRAILRRPQAQKNTVIKVGQLEIDPKYVKATLKGEELDLPPIEFSLLELFAKHPDEHFTARAIMDRVWSSESESSTDVVRVHITRLRKKLSKDPNKQVIQTVRGLGYFLDSQALED